mmetsp:Transcript_2172/g.2684  ORF Transcript_2172/g.2684 Transcript_2172/m.2684 type:complete len:529 (-) Transcript_2172:131-1717(-)
MKLIILGLLLGVTLGYNISSLNYNTELCKDMIHPECIKVAREHYNYSVPEIREMTTVMRLITERRIACKIAGHCPMNIPSVRVPEPCANGQIDNTWDCNNVNLFSFTSLSDLGSSGSANGNDIWGWTNPNDPAGGVKRYAITGQTDGATIVDITEPTNPAVLCFIPSKVSINTVWRDIKMVKNNNGVVFAAIVADRSGQGLQWVPMEAAITKCRNNRIAPNPYRLVENVDFGWIGNPVFTGGTNTHNIVGSDVDVDGFVVGETTKVYLVGSNSCSGGPLQVNFATAGTSSLLTPQPSFGGCFSSDGYSHDAECWTYSGPDTRYTGAEICVGYNENSITIIDYTNPSSPSLISRLTYPTSRYTHQGWRTTDQSYLLMDDELDESRGSVSSQTTYVVKITDLQNPVLLAWPSGITVIDHNLYIKQFCDSAGTCNDYAFEANYRAGLRILKIDTTNFDAAVNNPNLIPSLLTEVGFFKSWQGPLTNSFNGAWSNYPYFQDPSNPGLVVLQDIEQGLFVLDVCDAIPECLSS